MPKRHKPGGRGWKRRLQGHRVEIPPELTARILKSVVKGDSHWRLDPDDLALPIADQGSRRIVFESVFGRVSSQSEVYSKCGDRECVNPDHCTVENVKIHKMKLEGTLPRLVFAGGKQVVTVEDFERSLSLSPSRFAPRPKKKVTHDLPIA